MEKFTRLKAIAAPLLRINIDTDAIIPSREIKRVSKLGLGDGLFAGWRYTEPGGRAEDPGFILNRDPFRQAQILLSGLNFGCGSSANMPCGHWPNGESDRLSRPAMARFFTQIAREMEYCR